MPAKDVRCYLCDATVCKDCLDENGPWGTHDPKDHPAVANG